MLDSEVDSSIISHAKKLSEPAAKSFATTGSMLNISHPSSDRAGVCTDTFKKSNPALDKKSHDTNKESLKIT